MEHLVHILHLEDDLKDAELVQAIIESAGLTCEISHVQTRDGFAEALRRGGYDVILADYHLPMYDGVSALRLAQELCPDVPFIFVSGTMGEDAAIEGLTQGATDYVLKQKMSRLVPAMTRALRDAENRRERKRAESVQTAIYRISEAAQTAPRLDGLFGSIHAIIGALMPARNFYIALYDASADSIRFPYYADEFDSVPPPRKPDKSLTAYVLRTGNPLLATPQVFEQLIKSGQVESFGAPSVDWLGVPLKTQRGETIGVMAVQTYTEAVRLAGADQDVLAFVSTQVAMVIERKWAEEERERLTAQIREQARELQQILATVPEGVLLLDSERRIVQANPVAEKDLTILAGVKAGDILTHLGDRSLAELLTSPPTRGLWHEVKADQRVFEVIARPMDNGLEPEHWVLVINDVTQAREVREQLQQQERMAAVGQLAAGIAHDFNNIMAIIVLYAQMTAQVEALPAHVQERMVVINQQARHATRLIQQILDFSRRSVLERQPLDLLPLLKEQCKLLERTLPENIEVSLDSEPAEYIVNADLTRMQQVLMNLAVNARDAMPEGGKLRFTLSRTAPTDNIRCVACDEVPSGEWVRIAVADTGSGIPSEALPHIFEPFFTTKAPGQGTGLGLPQVYGIVGAHEGHIDVSTRMGKGTTFVIYLPPLLTRRPETVVLETQSVVAGGGEMLLVVEDDATLRTALVDTLKSLNYQVLEAANGQEALDTLQQRAREVALVISDLVMPGMGGQALFCAMKQRNLTLPVIMLTGHPMEQELRGLQAEGLTGWLLKPPDIEQLSRLLAQVLKEDA